MKRIHIIGSGPRTGTTLLAEVMHTCFQIDHHCEHEASICTDEPTSGEIFLTKQPGEISAVKWPLKLNPELYVLCIIRDPRDSIVSRHGSTPDSYWTGLRYWKQFVKLHPDLIGHPRFIYFKYEDFVSEPDEIQAYILRRLPFLRKLHNFTEYHFHSKPSKKSINALKSVRPIQPKGVGAWKKHLPRVKEQMHIHGDICSELIYYGYEENNDWAASLEGIHYVGFEQNRPQVIGFRDTWRHKKNQLLEVLNIILRRANIPPALIKRPFMLCASVAKKTVKPILKSFIQAR